MDKLLSQINPLPTPALTDILYAINTDGTIEGQITVQQIINLSQPYKKYVALLTQSGTDAPVATVHENTLGGTLVWSYVAVGIYAGTLVGAFPTANKVYFMLANPVSSVIVQGAQGSADTVDLVSKNSAGTLANGILTNCSIEIRVYS